MTNLAEPIDHSSFRRVADALATDGRVTTSRGDQLYALCPAHDDGNASLSVTWRVDSSGAGRTFVHCHTGCDPRAVVDALGLTLSDLFDTPPMRPSDPSRKRWEPRRPPRPRTAGSSKKKARGKGRQRIVATYGYQDADGRVIYEVTRWEPKEYTVRVVDSAGRRQPRWPVKERRVLYHLPEVLAAITDGRPVYVTEGEKDADALRAAGVTATCNAGGAAANGAQHDRWLPQYTTTLTGAHVVIVMDRDEDDPEEPGRQHAAHLYAELSGKAASLKVVQAVTGKDAADHLEAGHSVAELEPVDPATLNADLAAAAQSPAERPGDSGSGSAEPVDLLQERRRRRGSDDQPPPPPRPQLEKVRDEYAVIDDELCKIETEGRGATKRPVARVLLPVAPRLIRRLRQDLGDGAPLRVTHYDLTVTAHGETIEVPGVTEEEWRDLTWIGDLPWPVPFDDTHSGRSKIRAGIIAVSGSTTRETLYGTLGWRQIGDRWCYLHAGGALDGRGPRPDVRVEVAEKYQPFALPDPVPAGDRDGLRAALDASFALMEAVPDRLAVPMLGAAYRACLGYSRVTVLPLGGPSSGKTGLAAVGQQHYAPTARHEHLPFGAGEDAATLTSLEEHRFTVGDMLTIVDDAAPDRGTEALGRRLNVLARSQAEQRGKDRGARTGGIRPEHKPRSLLGITAEQWTGIESAETRVVTLDMRRGELKPYEVFGPLDQDGGPELRAQLIATLVQHVADRMPMTTWLRETRAALTDAMIRRDSPDPGVEARRSEAVADLAVGWRALLDMAVARGAMTEEEATARWQRVWSAMIEVRDRMMAGSVERRPTEIAAAALRSAFVRQSAALLDRQTGQQPVHAELCGWEPLPGGPMDSPGWRRVGTVIGWTDGDRIWLDPSATTDEITRHARAAGLSLNLTRDGLGAALADAGILRCRMTKHGRRTTVKIRLGHNGSGPGPQTTVWEAPWEWLWSGGEDDPDDGDEQTPDAPLPDPGSNPVTPSDDDLGPPADEEIPPLPPQPRLPEPPSTDTTNKLTESARPAAPSPAGDTPTWPQSDRAAPTQNNGASTPRAGYSGVALVAAAAYGWLARPGEPPAPVELGTDASSLATLLQRAESLNLGHRDGGGRYRGANHAYGQLWLLPPARERLGLPAELTYRTGVDKREPADHRAVREMIEAAGWELGSRTISGWNVVYRKGGRRLHLVIPEWQSEPSPFGELSEPAQVLANRLGTYAATVGVAYRYSPGVTGIALVATTRPDIAHAPRPELPEPSTVPTLEGDYSWQRALQPDEEQMPWVDLWDVNGMYLGAASSLPLGIGAPEEITDNPQFDPNLPGYWRIASPVWEHARLPDPLVVYGRRRGNEQLWVTTPTMKILTELHGIEPEINKAWVWQRGNSVRVLDKWAKDLREGRKALLGATGDDERAVLDAVKATYRAGIGRLDASTWRGTDYSLSRPDWRHHVVGQGRYALTRRMVAAAEQGFFPLAVAVDAVLYASASPEPVPPPGWVAGDQLGQVKHVGRLPTDQVAHLLAEGAKPTPSTYDDDGAIVTPGLIDSFKLAGDDR